MPTSPAMPSTIRIRMLTPASASMAIHTATKMMVLPKFFFFQAEDGIRDHCVTGVQTCALQIFRSGGGAHAPDGAGVEARRRAGRMGARRSRAGAVGGRGAGRYGVAPRIPEERLRRPPPAPMRDYSFRRAWADVSPRVQNNLSLSSAPC